MFAPVSWLEWFGGADGWVRPRPSLARADIVTGVLVALGLTTTLELMRSFADFEGARPHWVEYLALGTVSMLVVLRRRWPLTVTALVFAHFFAASSWVPEVGYTMTYQMVVFFLLYSGVAWAADRRVVAVLVLALALGFTVWLGWDFAVGQGISRAREAYGMARGGFLPPVTAYVLFTAFVNALFLLGSLAMGQVAWRQARGEARLAEQAELISTQAAGLREQAVVDERLRIARELHDVVAHHVSVMGIQAAGARRLITKDPERATEALAHVEQSSRTAVTQMRQLLGALRGATEAGGHETSVGGSGRDPQPTLDQLPQLVDQLRAEGFETDLQLVEHPQGAAAQLPLPVQLSLFRTVQEALTNVRRHSTAHRAQVVVRVEGGRHAEVEVLDEGRPRGGTSGSGLGLLGMRERVTSHGGESEIGPRVTGGYRVRVRFPLTQVLEVTQV